ncbi:MAG: hypothetical protein CVT93_08935 [Bacteroidetes bacterium HGW-Bacteroidetes-10]|nr:MAG: hypothetical protein CVT93_08935 [Bacteroidetes bacterium HGW-Bacteroidetes-10]
MKNPVLYLILAVTILFSSVPSFAQRQIVINSSNLKCNDTVLVFTPKGWSSEMESAPALFLLHGWSGDWSNWSKRADIQSMSDKYGFIIITPDGFYNSWYLNNIDPAKMQWRTFFDKELYPLIVKEYNLKPEKTFISGLSMGGHGAINIYLDDITRFRGAGSMSGVLRLDDTRLKTSDIPKVIGPYAPDAPLYRANSAIHRLEGYNSQLEKAGKEQGKIMLITCGAQDGLARSAYDFTAKCDSLKIPVILHISPGNHTWNYWEFSLDQHLFIFSRIAKGEHIGY